MRVRWRDFNSDLPFSSRLDNYRWGGAHTDNVMSCTDAKTVSANMGVAGGHDSLETFPHGP